MLRSSDIVLRCLDLEALKKFLSVDTMKGNIELLLYICKKLFFLKVRDPDLIWYMYKAIYQIIQILEEGKKWADGWFLFSLFYPVIRRAVTRDSPTQTNTSTASKCQNVSTPSCSVLAF